MEPTIIEAWLTLVRRDADVLHDDGDADAERAPEPAMAGVSGPAAQVARAAGNGQQERRPARTGRRSASRAASHSRDSLDSAMLDPPQQSGGGEGGDSAAAVRCVHASYGSVGPATDCADQRASAQLLFGAMAVALDEIDIQLLSATPERTQTVTNVELARSVGLSPAATLHRVRRLKESGRHPDRSAPGWTRRPPGFALQVYVAATLTRHDPRSSRDAFEDHAPGACRRSSRPTWWPGEMDYLLTRRRPATSPSCSRCSASLAFRGGQQLTTYLKLQEVKPLSPLPLGAPVVPPVPSQRALDRRQDGDDDQGDQDDAHRAADADPVGHEPDQRAARPGRPGSRSR